MYRLFSRHHEGPMMPEELSPDEIDQHRVTLNPLKRFTMDEPALIVRKSQFAELCPGKCFSQEFFRAHQTVRTSQDNNVVSTEQVRRLEKGEEICILSECKVLDSDGLREDIDFGTVRLNDALATAEHENLDGEDAACDHEVQMNDDENVAVSTNKCKVKGGSDVGGKQESDGAAEDDEAEGSTESDEVSSKNGSGCTSDDEDKEKAKSVASVSEGSGVAQPPADLLYQLEWLQLRRQLFDERKQVWENRFAQRAVLATHMDTVTTAPFRVSELSHAEAAAYSLEMDKAFQRLTNIPTVAERAVKFEIRNMANDCITSGESGFLKSPSQDKKVFDAYRLRSKDHDPLGYKRFHVTGEAGWELGELRAQEVLRAAIFREAVRSMALFARDHAGPKLETSFPEILPRGTFDRGQLLSYTRVEEGKECFAELQQAMSARCTLGFVFGKKHRIFATKDRPHSEDWNEYSCGFMACPFTGDLMPYVGLMDRGRIAAWEDGKDTGDGTREEELKQKTGALVRLRFFDYPVFWPGESPSAEDMRGRKVQVSLVEATQKTGDAPACHRAEVCIDYPKQYRCAHTAARKGRVEHQSSRVQAFFDTNEEAREFIADLRRLRRFVFEVSETDAFRSVMKSFGDIFSWLPAVFPDVNYELVRPNVTGRTTGRISFKRVGFVLDCHDPELVQLELRRLGSMPWLDVCTLMLRDRAKNRELCGATMDDPITIQLVAVNPTKVRPETKTPLEDQNESDPEKYYEYYEADSDSNLSLTSKHFPRRVHEEGIATTFENRVCRKKPVFNFRSLGEYFRGRLGKNKNNADESDPGCTTSDASLDSDDYQKRYPPRQRRESDLLFERSAEWRRLMGPAPAVDWLELGRRARDDSSEDEW
ncbi:unnamed protein product [Amoebophrya sp. A120]|nr:unnamed protein product [Amoebophrya sp. A120]|eukprot:GSA120T00002763001.1